MGIHEECGVFGVLSAKKENVAELVYYGLYALQHRGQESCGSWSMTMGSFPLTRTWDW